jgi:hypothetical protein
MERAISSVHVSGLDNDDPLIIRCAARPPRSPLQPIEAQPYTVSFVSLLPRDNRDTRIINACSRLYLLILLVTKYRLVSEAPFQPGFPLPESSSGD